jgi:TetR/AcrR family transcriptional regulator
MSELKSSKRRGRPPGRRSGDVAVASKPELIDVAARLFAMHGYEATSLREVAEGAGVTPAMVAYYFRDKAGLLEAVVVSGLELMLQTLREVVDGPDDVPFLSRFLRAYLVTLSDKPWLPQILVREVISRDGPLRQLFIDRFAVNALELVPPKVLEEITAGRLRADLDPRFAMLSMLGMCVFPFIAEPVLGPMLGYQLDSEFADDYSRHLISLMERGAAVAGGDSGGVDE